MNSKTVRLWLHIIIPILIYQAAFAGCRILLQQVAAIPADIVSPVLTVGLLPPVLLAYCLHWNRETAKPVSDAPVRFWNTLLWVFIGCVMAMAAVSPGGGSAEGGALRFLGACICGPLTEEILYRGQFIGRGEKELGGVQVLLVSTLLFAAGHVSMGNALLAIPAGLLLGALYLYERSVAGITAAHCLANILIYLFADAAPHNTGLLVCAVMTEVILSFLLIGRSRSAA